MAKAVFSPLLCTSPPAGRRDIAPPLLAVHLAFALAFATALRGHPPRRG